MLARGGALRYDSDSEAEEGRRLLWEDVEVDFIARLCLIVVAVVVACSIGRR